MLLSPAPISTDRFTRTGNVLVAEISDFGRDFDFGRVYDDACDVGLTLISARTGARIVFEVEREHRDGEGELQCWIMAPVKRQPGMTSAVEDLRLHIFND